LSTRACKIYSLEKEPTYSIDPFFGNGRIYHQISNDQIERLKSTCTSMGFEFLPSFEGREDPCHETWKYLMYLHIPKCGGTSFEQPLHIIKQHLLELQRRTPSIGSTSRYLNTGNQLTDKFEVATLMHLISNDSCNEFKSIFFATHYIEWGALHKHVCEAMHAYPMIIATVRDPNQRLISHIKHEASSKCFTLKDLLALIETEDSIFNNSMYNHIYDFRAFDSTNYYKSESKDCSIELFENIDFVDINDSYTISKIKSAFLSASLLPNVVQFSRLNDSQDRKKSNNCRLSDDEIEYAFKRCQRKGYLKKDQSIDYDFLKRRTLKRLKFPSLGKKVLCQIHPLTFLISKESVGSIVQTKKFISDPILTLEKLDL